MLTRRTRVLARVVTIRRNIALAVACIRYVPALLLLPGLGFNCQKGCCPTRTTRAMNHSAKRVLQSDDEAYHCGAVIRIGESLGIRCQQMEQERDQPAVLSKRL